jgi:hypothetical protein
MIDSSLLNRVEDYVREKGSEDKPLTPMRVTTALGIDLDEAEAALICLLGSGRVVQSEGSGPTRYYIPMRDYKAEAASEVPDPRDYAEADDIDPEYYCEICDKHFENQAGLSSHKRYKHGKPKVDGLIERAKDKGPIVGCFDTRGEVEYKADGSMHIKTNIGMPKVSSNVIGDSSLLGTLTYTGLGDYTITGNTVQLPPPPPDHLAKLLELAQEFRRRAESEGFACELNICYQKGCMRATIAVHKGGDAQ